jgi:hypothetical protein
LKSVESCNCLIIRLIRFGRCGSSSGALRDILQQPTAEATAAHSISTMMVE